ncbi:MAG: hypothetical protein N2654_01210 [Deltaproteobacteria bacterium]|nr:hypothetical protein [Deltaproteobacteria bacterium]
MKLLFVTTNRGKYLVGRKILAEYGIKLSQTVLSIPEIQGDVREIAQYKAREAFKQLQAPLLVLDAGFCIPSLRGFPGAYASYSLKTIGVTGLLSLVRTKGSICYFHEVLCYCSSSVTKTFEAKLWGRLSREPRGEMKAYHWSELAMVFVPRGHSKTLAELNRHVYEKTLDKLQRYWRQLGRYLKKTGQ